MRLLHRWRDEAAQAEREIDRIVVAFEAGRDGFWLARWLRSRGIEAYVMHPSSVAVSREHRRAKTDRLDTELLMRAFLGWLRGEKRHCSMAAIPTIEEEDAKRPNREREKEKLAALRTAEGIPLPENTQAEFRRDMARLRLVREQIKAIAQERLRKLETASAAEKGPRAMVRLIASVIGVGIETADMLVHEVLSRNLRDRKAVARYAGLTGGSVRDGPITQSKESVHRRVSIPGGDPATRRYSPHVPQL